MKKKQVLKENKGLLSGKKIIVYPTSANPPTWGHADIMARAAQQFDTLYWLAAKNPYKELEIPLKDRLIMMKEYVDYFKFTNVVVDHFEGAVIRYAEKMKASFLLRGLRNTTDFHLELELAAGNRGINKNIETVCMFAKPHFATISSSLIRELASLEERIDQYVLPSVAERIKQLYKKKK